jgi:catechol 2,3-dioxygenase-like lactoylglutathione lyase family enzyme
MTQIKGYIPASRRPGVLGVHSIDHFSLVVPDMEEARNFYTNFGLNVQEKQNTLEMSTAASGHRWGRLLEGPRKKLNYLSFGCFEDDFSRFKERLQQLGVKRLDPPPGFETDGLWFRDLDGILIEIGIAEKTSPNEKSSKGFPTSAPGVRAAPLRSDAPRIYPGRLAHVLIYARDIPRSLQFYSETLGLRESDRAGDVGFLHAVHGCDHHIIAFAHSSAPGFHHCSWDVPTVNEIGLGAMYMAGKGFTRGWGFGRHVLGSNFFHYIRDPWGSYSEYSSDIDYFPCDKEVVIGNQSPENGFYLWGPTPPEDFAHNYESESVDADPVHSGR